MAAPGAGSRERALVEQPWTKPARHSSGDAPLPDRFAWPAYDVEAALD